MRKLLAKLKSLPFSLAWDAVALAGFALLAYGAWLAWAPAAAILGGMFLIFIAIVGAWRCS
jgi:hypothetical protein